MLLYKQLELFAPAAHFYPGGQRSVVAGDRTGATTERCPPGLRRGRDRGLEQRARDLLHSLGAGAIAREVRVAWSARLRTAAGRADYHRKRLTMNPRLRDFGEAEVERTFLHELAHFLAQFRAGRRRIPPHGAQWRKACADLGIPGEARCHSLPFTVQRRARPYLYRCPQCARDFPRVRRLRRRLACLACCRRFNRGDFDARFQLRLVKTVSAASVGG